MTEPRFFVSELWGYAIRPAGSAGGGKMSHPTSPTLTVFDRYYTPPAIRKSFRPGNGRTRKKTVDLAYALCDELNASEPWPDPVPLDPFWTRTAA